MYIFGNKTMSQINFLCVEKRMAALVGWGHEIESNL